MSRKKTYKEFIDEYLNKYGKLKYFFDEKTYINTHTPMRIICPKHGEFWKTPKNIMKYECIKCSYEKRGSSFMLTNDEFIKKARKIHGDKYDYSRVRYTGTKNDIIIICPKHGEFKQKPNDHLSGKGCRLCSESHLEREVKQILDSKKVVYISQYKPKWLGKQSIDFFIPSLSIGIECQGKQHFGYGGWGKSFDFQKQFSLDNNKYRKCLQKGVRMIYVIENDVNYIYPQEIEYIKDVINLSNLEQCITEKV